MIDDKRFWWPLFVIMVLAQLATPAWMIYNKKSIAEKGEIYKFELEAIDPNDPYRGKYIVLNPKERKFRINTENENRSTTMFATFTTDSLGYAKIQNLSSGVPEHQNYLEVKTIGYLQKGSVHPVTIDYPFDRYYMNEHKALDAEKLSREVSRDTSRTCYAEVVIYGGQSSLLAVKIDGVPIEQLIHN